MTTTKRLLLGLATLVWTTTAQAGEGKGSLDKEQIRKVVREHIVEIRDCYNAALQGDPEAKGRVVIDFTIGEQGQVTQAAVGSSDMTSDAAPSCMRDVIRGWSFPKPSGGSVQVSYPFVLEPG